MTISRIRIPDLCAKTNRQIAAADGKGLKRALPCAAMVHGVLGDGEHHDATGATWYFCCCHDRAGSLRLYLYAAANERAAQVRPSKNQKPADQPRVS